MQVTLEAGGAVDTSHLKKARLREWFHQLQKDAPMDLWLQVGGGEFDTADTKKVTAKNLPWVAKVCPWDVEFLEGFSRDLYTFITAMLLLMAEIRRSPVEVGSLSHHLRWVLGTSQVIFSPDFWLPSTVSVTLVDPLVICGCQFFSIGIQDRSTFPGPDRCNQSSPGIFGHFLGSGTPNLKLPFVTVRLTSGAGVV